MALIVLFLITSFVGFFFFAFICSAVHSGIYSFLYCCCCLCVFLATVFRWQLQHTFYKGATFYFFFYCERTNEYHIIYSNELAFFFSSRCFVWSLLLLLFIVIGFVLQKEFMHWNRWICFVILKIEQFAFEFHITAWSLLRARHRNKCDVCVCMRVWVFVSVWPCEIRRNWCTSVYIKLALIERPFKLRRHRTGDNINLCIFNE